MTRLSSENVGFKVTRANYIRWFFHSILSRCKEIIKFLLCFVISESDNIQTCCILLFHIDGKTIGSNNITFWRIWNYFLLSDDRTKFNTLYPVSVPLCHPENSYIEAPQNCQPQRNFSNFGNRWKSENWSGKIVFQFKPMEHSHANVQSYSPYYGILCNFLWIIDKLLFEI